MAFADEHDGLVLDAAIRSKQPLIPNPVNTKSTASSMVVLLFIDDDAEIVRLKLDLIQLRIQLLALSEMLQWVWRSAIRDDKPINLYIPSRRMRELLIDWINTTNQGGYPIE